MLVARYELAREVMLVADGLLAGSPMSRQGFRSELASGGRFTGLFSPEGWPQDSYLQVSRVVGPKRLKAFDLLPAVKLRGRFAPSRGQKTPVTRAIGIRRIQANYDDWDMHYGPDVLFELSVSRFEVLGISQAVKDFEAWARASGYFDLKNPGGRPSSTLLHLAYFRFIKQFDKPKPSSWFAESIKRSSGPYGGLTITDYGRELYAPCMGRKGISAASWSEGVARIGRIVMPAAERIAGVYLSVKR